jgi:hypothetical protein
MQKKNIYRRVKRDKEYYQRLHERTTSSCIEEYCLNDDNFYYQHLIKDIHENCNEFCLDTQYIVPIIENGQYIDQIPSWNCSYMDQKGKCPYRSWNEYIDKISLTNRVSFDAKSILDDVFSFIDNLEQKCIKILPKGFKIYRGRVAEYSNTLKWDSKDLSISPNPNSGRFNYPEQSYFYGAENIEVVIKELRPSINDEITIGEFELLKEISYFDFAIKDNIINFIAQHISKPIINNLSYG